MTNPTPEQSALSILVQLAHAARLTRDERITVENATNVLIKLVTPLQPQASANGEGADATALETAVGRR